MTIGKPALESAIGHRPSAIGQQPATDSLQPAADSRQPTAPALPCPRLVAALVSGLVLWMCFFPLALGWLAWVALVPLLTLVRAEMSAKKLFWCGWLAGLVFFWPALQWMRVADARMYYGWALLATYCSFYFPAALLLIRLLDRRTGLPLVVTVPAIWTGLEFVRSFMLTGFAWYFLGHTQHAFLPIIQVADLGGAYAVSLVVAAVNALLFEALYAWPAWRAFWRLPMETHQSASMVRLWVQGGLVGGLFLAVLIYGWGRIHQAQFTAGPRVALLQGNLDQRLRNQAFHGEQGNQDPKKFLFDYYRALTLRANYQYPQPDLIVWPETSFPYIWLEMPSKLEAIPAGKKDYQILLGQLVRAMAGKECQTNLLLGLNCNIVDEANRETQYNSALLVTKTGNVGERYDKIHRVPFGEYVPFKDWLTFLNDLAPYDFDYSIAAGEKSTRLTFTTADADQPKDYRFGVLVCYEDTDPFLARKFGRATADEPAADFLVNISNDGWFNGSSEHEEHLAISRFRAVECRRALVRAVNMGISAVIDSNGRVLLPKLQKTIDDVNQWQVVEQDGQVPALPLSEWSGYKKVQGIITATVPLDDRLSLYALWGDWLPISCWVLIGFGLLWSLPKRTPSPGKS